jgi:hypothetical protein
MLGDSGIHTYELWKPYLLTPRQFIGVDIDPCVVNRCLQGFLSRPSLDRFRAVLGDAYQVAVQASKLPEYPAGVFLFDDMGLAGSDSWWMEHRGLLRQTVRTAIARLGACVVLINRSLERSEGGPEKALEQYAKHLQGVFGEYGLTTDRLLGDRSELPKLFNFGSRNDPEGRNVGAFQVYRSEGRVTRMATIRLRLQRMKSSDVAVFLERNVG